MNLTHLHLVLNHFPVIGTLLGALILGWALLRNNKELLSIASFIIVLMSITGFAVMFTGDAAEETVENIPGISEIAMEAHEAAAETSIWVLLAAGAFGIISLIWKNLLNNPSKLPFVLTFIISALAFASMSYTGYLGGKIRHTELDNGISSSIAAPIESHSEHEEED
jgi:hypothetical protein